MGFSQIMNGKGEGGGHAQVSKDVALSAANQEKLDAQLDREAKRFFNESRNISVDDPAKLLSLSGILSFFTSDFLAHAPSLAAYVNRYRDAKVPESYTVRFIPYDWTINRQP